MLGVFWALAQPLAMLLVYTFVFSKVFKARWSEDLSDPTSFAVVLFAGLIVFNLFSENVNAAPKLVVQQVSYVKKIVFPLEILPWIAMCTSLLTALISAVLLALFQIVFIGLPPLTIVWVPLIMLVLCLATLGFVWVLAALGVYLRDLQHVTGILTTVLMFLSPVFYPLSAVPPSFRYLILLNPITVVVEMLRGSLFFGVAPSPVVLCGALAASWTFAACGFWWFMRLRKGFADVV